MWRNGNSRTLTEYKLIHPLGKFKLFHKNTLLKTILFRFFIEVRLLKILVSSVQHNDSIFLLDTT